MCVPAAGCRRYYTEVVNGLPHDTLVLTLGCGKYRFYDSDLGTLPNGLPRLLDMGQVRQLSRRTHACALHCPALGLRMAACACLFGSGTYARVWLLRCTCLLHVCFSGGR